MQIFRYFTATVLAGVLLATPAPGLEAGVFGDGDPANGVEDSRLPVSAVSRRDHDLDGWRLNPGTLFCDGRLRGTAVPLDVSSFGFESEGLVLMTAAHVLHDLERRQPFARCQFHVLGLGELPAYRHEVDLARRLTGDFSAGADRSDPGFGRGDWAFLYVPGPVPAAQRNGLPIRAFSGIPGEFPRLQFRMLGWNETARQLQVSGPCQVIESGPNDLGGGAWPGQLLDDCDSGQGASGGAYLAARGEDLFIVGIRTGAHWDAIAFPAERYPGGPPPGSAWNPLTGTNFGRAVDPDMLAALHRFLGSLAQFAPR